MDVEQELGNCHAERLRAEKMIDWLMKYGKDLRPFPTNRYSTFIEMNPDSFEEARDMLRALPIKYWKRDEHHTGQGLDYRGDLDGVTIIIRKAPPPPSCEIQSYTEDIPAQPAQTVTKFRVKCKDPDEADAAQAEGRPV